MTAQLDTRTLYQTSQPATTKADLALTRSASAAQTLREQRLAEQIERQAVQLKQQEEALLFLAGLVKGLQVEVQQLKQLPAPPCDSAALRSGCGQGGQGLQVDQAIEIYRTAANGKMYWHLKTSRYAKHGVALWPDESTLAALGVTLEWLKGLPFDRPTPFPKMVRIAVNAEGKKPKVVGVA